MIWSVQQERALNSTEAWLRDPDGQQVFRLLGYAGTGKTTRYDEFDYGYALTVHKAQGSQWGDVILIDESRCFRNDRARWLYTGITRASERVTVVTRR